MDTIIWIIILGSSLAFGGGFIIAFGLNIFRGNQMNTRLQDFVVDSDPTGQADARMQEIMQRELTGSFFRRTIIPLFGRIFSYLGRFTPDQVLHDLDHQLTIARNPFNLRAPEFYGIRMFMGLAGLGLGIFVIYRNQDLTHIAMGVGTVIVFYLGPSYWLRFLVRKVQNSIRKALPDALDMLSVCATAGLSFDQSLQRVSDYWHTELGIELRRVVQEMELGISRADALRNMSNRLEVAELSSFVAIIVQAETLGMRIADVLHSQAEQMRVMKQFRAKEMASRLPAKMMVPLALLILPALLAVIMGPMVPVFINSFG